MRHHMRDVKWLLKLSGGLALLMILAIAGSPRALAQDATPAGFDPNLVNPPFAIYTGTCTDLSAKPDYELGRLLRLPYGSDTRVGENPATPLAEGAFLGEDANGNGELDEGEDVNQNGQLDEGIDEDGDGILDETEIVERGPIAPFLLAGQGEADVNFEDLQGAPHAVVVLAGDEAPGTPVSCGEVGGVTQDDQLVIALEAVNRSGYYGYAVLEQDTDFASVPNQSMTVVTVYLFDRLTNTGEERPEATPIP